MEKYCQNQLCENEAAKEVPVSVNKSSDQSRAVCAACDEAYSWGVQHGRMISTPKKTWVITVTYKDSVVHATVVKSKRQAIKSLAIYLRDHEGYNGPAKLPDISDWMAEHDERLGADIFTASIDLG